MIQDIIVDEELCKDKDKDNQWKSIYIPNEECKSCDNGYELQRDKCVKIDKNLGETGDCEKVNSKLIINAINVIVNIKKMEINANVYKVILEKIVINAILDIPIYQVLINVLK